MPDVAGELRDEEKVSLSSQGPGGGGVGLGDGAGEGLVVSVDNQPPPFDVVLELLDGGRDGQKKESAIKIYHAEESLDVELGGGEGELLDGVGRGRIPSESMV